MKHAGSEVLRQSLMFFKLQLQIIFNTTYLSIGGESNLEGGGSPSYFALRRKLMIYNSFVKC